jgi:hypothetical protein
VRNSANLILEKKETKKKKPAILGGFFGYGRLRAFHIKDVHCLIILVVGIDTLNLEIQDHGFIRILHIAFIIPPRQFVAGGGSKDNLLRGSELSFVHRESNHCTFNVGEFLAFGAEVFLLIRDSFGFIPEIHCRNGN